MPPIEIQPVIQAAALGTPRRPRDPGVGPHPNKATPGLGHPHASGTIAEPQTVLPGNPGKPVQGATGAVAIDAVHLPGKAATNAGHDVEVGATGKPQHPPMQPITGKVFALRDGSGYAIQSRDGHYYRVGVKSSHGLAFARVGGAVDAAMVNVSAGAVSTLNPTAAPAADNGADALLPRTKPKDPVLHLPGSNRAEKAIPGEAVDKRSTAPPLPNARRAAESSNTAHTMIVGQPHQAVRSQANVPPEHVVALLRR